MKNDENQMVDPKYRRRGISTKLMELFLAKLQAKGADECVLETEVGARGSEACIREILD